MLRTQSLVCVAEWYYSSLKAFHVNINIYSLLLRKTLKTNLHLTAERICSYNHHHLRHHRRPLPPPTFAAAATTATDATAATYGDDIAF